MSDVDYRCTKHVVNGDQNNNDWPSVCHILTEQQVTDANAEIRSWPIYEPTPLVDLSDIASAAKVKKVYYKDEASRFGLGSFKALGGAYAVHQLACERQRSHASSKLVVCTATDGNHGRSVAWGAQGLGIECHIFIHEQVSPSRADQMAKFGAIIHRVDGNYDDSVVACAKMADQHQWQILSDTSWEGYETVPVQIMAGYSVMAAEVVAQLDGEIPTHIVIQAGCGGMAGAMIACFWREWREALPTIVVVESELSDCVFQSMAAGQMKFVDITEETLMAGLSCGEVSRVAWPLLKSGVRHALTIGDEAVAPMMRWLANPTVKDRPSIVAGECSASGLIGLLGASQDPALKSAIGLNAASRVLVFGTEGATDPELYDRLMHSQNNVAARTR
ncbi:MAG: diaminopropionate ammonia-lyase [Chromatiales bacterium]|jgi:diaminopropionate ammonia-lyase|nr:diaminopropionate ammonia-lyase [Chromatiales bacterium]